MLLKKDKFNLKLFLSVGKEIDITFGIFLAKINDASVKNKCKSGNLHFHYIIDTKKKFMKNKCTLKILFF